MYVNLKILVGWYLKKNGKPCILFHAVIDLFLSNFKYIYSQNVITALKAYLVGVIGKRIIRKLHGFYRLSELNNIQGVQIITSQNLKFT